KRYRKSPTVPTGRAVGRKQPWPWSTSFCRSCTSSILDWSQSTTSSMWGWSRTGIRNAHYHHSVMQQGTVETGDRGLLATVLGSGGREKAADLADESPAEPEL